MSRFKTKLNTALRSGKIKVFFLFVVLSFSILLLTKLSKDYTKTLTFDIKVNNLPEDRLVINDSSHVFNITLRTYGFKLLRYSLSNPEIGLDFNKIQDNKDHFLWINSNHSELVRSQFLPNAQILNIQPDSLKFYYDKQSVKLVPVVLEEDVSFEKGFNLIERFKTEPDSVRVIGPKSLVDSLQYVLTEELTLENVKETITQTLNLIAPEPRSDLKLSTSNIIVTGNVDKFTEGSIQVPITITNLPQDVTINYFPKKITVLFSTHLGNYSNIKVSDFKVECDYSRLLPEASYLIPEIVLKPKGVKTAKINQNKIEFILSK